MLERIVEKVQEIRERSAEREIDDIVPIMIDRGLATQRQVDHCLKDPETLDVISAIQNEVVKGNPTQAKEMLKKLNTAELAAFVINTLATPEQSGEPE